MWIVFLMGQLAPPTSYMVWAASSLTGLPQTHSWSPRTLPPAFDPSGLAEQCRRLKISKASEAETDEPVVEYEGRDEPSWPVSCQSNHVLAEVPTQC